MCTNTAMCVCACLFPLVLLLVLSIGDYGYVEAKQKYSIGKGERINAGEEDVVPNASKQIERATGDVLVISE